MDEIVHKASLDNLYVGDYIDAVKDFYKVLPPTLFSKCKKFVGKSVSPTRKTNKLKQYESSDSSEDSDMSPPPQPAKTKMTIKDTFEP